jgi:hypothetical protein
MYNKKSFEIRKKFQELKGEDYTERLRENPETKKIFSYKLNS